MLAELAADIPLASFSVDTSNPELAMRAVEQGHAHLAVINASRRPVGREITAEQIGTEELILVTSDSHWPASGSVSVDELRTLPFVCSPSGLIRRKLVEDALSSVGVEMRNVVIELGHPEAMKVATKRGLGFCLLFRCSVGANSSAIRVCR